MRRLAHAHVGSAMGTGTDVPVITKTAARNMLSTIIMPKNNYWLRRFRRHLVLAAGAVTIVFSVYAATPPPDVRHRLSVATAYTSLMFLAASLWLGPWNVLRRRPNPISFDLRRDVGIWTGILAVLHTAIGLTVHLRGRMWMYFFKRLHPFRLQNTLFGFANFTGLGAALLFLMLLAISNDLSLRTLGTRLWKSLQRWTYAALILTAIHSVAYQLVEKRHLAWVFLFTVLMIAVATVQIFGFLWVQKADERESGRLAITANQNPPSRNCD
jgi:methionine sulfoxide reductase heme-binding subunit